MKTISIVVCNEKGGVGKSTTATTYAYNLVALNYKVLAIDFDPQGGLSDFCGADNENSYNIIDVLYGNCGAADAIQSLNGLDVIPANNALSEINAYVNLTADSFTKALSDIKNNYDYIIYDTAPEPKTKSIFAVLSASDFIVLPVLAEPEPALSLAKMVKTIMQVKGKQGLKRTAVLITRYDPRPNIYRQYRDLTKRYCDAVGIHSLETAIRVSCVVSESQACLTPLSVYKRYSGAAKDYKQATDELVAWVVK